MKVKTLTRVAAVATAAFGWSVFVTPSMARPVGKGKQPAPAVEPATRPVGQPGAGCCGKCAAPADSVAAPATKPAVAASTQPERGPGGVGMRDVMSVFHQLLTDHAQIKRQVEDIPGGVVTVTTSDNPAIAALIRTHVVQMKERVENGQPVRRWDPLFAEIFRHGDKIVMKIESIDGGVRVTETSDDPQVALLVRQHAHRGVSEFVARGFDRAHEASPLPEGYDPAKAPAPKP